MNWLTPLVVAELAAALIVFRSIVSEPKTLLPIVKALTGCVLLASPSSLVEPTFSRIATLAKLEPAKPISNITDRCISW